MILTMLVYFLASASFSFDVHECEVKASPKGQSYSVSKILYLSSGPQSLENQTVIADTKLNLLISQGELIGSVNDQFRFILEGHYTDGRFESAQAKGTIACREKQASKALLLFKPQKTWVPVEQELKKFEQSKLNNFCYYGDIKFLADAYLKIISESPTEARTKVFIENKKDLIISRKENICLAYSNAYDPHGIRCLDWVPGTHNYVISSCSSSDSEHP
jgi:hypothetical protein